MRSKNIRIDIKYVLIMNKIKNIFLNNCLNRYYKSFLIERLVSMKLVNSLAFNSLSNTNGFCLSLKKIIILLLVSYTK